MPEERPDARQAHSTPTQNKAGCLFICTNLFALLSAAVSAWNLARQYPLMREFFLLFLFSEAASLCRPLIFRAKSGTRGYVGYIRCCLTDWLTAKAQKKLLATRAFFLLVLIFLLALRPDFFKANIIMLTGIVIILVLLAMRAADTLRQRCGRRQDDREYETAVQGKACPQTERGDASSHLTQGVSASAQTKHLETSPQSAPHTPAPTPKKRMKTLTKIVSAAAAFLLYIVLGVLFSGFPQPEISDGYKENFHPESFYGSAPHSGTAAGSAEGNSTQDGTAPSVTCSDRAVILEDNSEALIERVRMIRGAKERIILSTFDFRPDISGKILLAALLDAAERGVSVRVVVDGVSGLLRMEQNPYFFALSSHENAEIRIYNRVNPLMPWRLMGRLHDKYLVADDTAYILGGRNSFSYFLGEWPGHKNYDRDVLVYNAGGDTASSLYQVEAYFNEVWNLKYTSTFHNRADTADRTCVKRAAAELKELYAQYLSDYPAAETVPDYLTMTYPTKKITLLANPTTAYAKEPTVFYALTELMKQAKHSVTIHTPYIIANGLMYDAFAQIAAAVPDARMMTNSVANNGNPFGAGDYRANFDKIRATGMQLLEYEGGISYHGKSIVIDDDLSIVGSFNMDMRSVYLDTELMLVIDSIEVNAQLRSLLARYEYECAIVQPDGSRVFPTGVVPQEVSSKKEFNMKVLYNLLRWARRLL